MSDLKISALPASNVPLAGIEVLPIVQSGTTKQVAVSDLTAGRNVAVGAAVGVPRTFSVGGSVALDRFAATPTIAMRGGTDATVGHEYRLSMQQARGLFLTNALIGGSQVNHTDFSPNGDLTLGTGNLVIGTDGKGFVLPGGITWRSGVNNPEGVVTAPVGSLYSRTDGGLLSSLYVKESGSGNTGWVGK